jgi:hypothetical protein
MNCQCCGSEPCLEALDNALSSSMDCIYCGQPVLLARWEAGYNYCMSASCSHQLRERREEYRLILMPKQGFTYVKSDSPDLLSGKSSGRQ